MTPLAFYGDLETLEGPEAEGVVIVGFPDAEAAKAWYNSDKYQEAKAIRLKAADYRVILVNDAAVSPALGQSLVKYAELGGGLILSTGPHTEPAAFNQAFSALPAGPAGPTWKLAETVSLRGDFVTLSDVKTDHPIFEIFRESGRLSLAHVFSFHKATPGEKTVVLARYDDGTPALLETPLGTGKILLYTTTLDSSWNDLPQIGRAHV